MAGLFTGCASEKSVAESQKEKLNGTWYLVYQQSHGKKVPDEKASELCHGKMIFTQDKIRYTAELPGFDFEFAYTLNTEQQPKGIDLEVTDTPDKKGIGQKSFGIYRLQDGKLEICHSRSKRPKAFVAPQGSDNSLIVLERKLRSDSAEVAK